jgi:hypothetical protein
VDDLDSDEIPMAGLEAGIALAEFYVGEALRLGETAAEDADLVLAEATLAWIQAYDRVCLVQVYQGGPYAVRNAKTARRILTVLEEHGWVRRLEGGAEIEGVHRGEVWEVCR